MKSIDDHNKSLRGQFKRNFAVFPIACCFPQSVNFFGRAVSSNDFEPEDLNVHSSYYRGPVQQRALPTGVLAAFAIVLLIIFLLW